MSLISNNLVFILSQPCQRSKAGDGPAILSSITQRNVPRISRAHCMLTPDSKLHTEVDARNIFSAFLTADFQ